MIVPKRLWSVLWHTPAWSTNGAWIAIVDGNPSSRAYGDLYVVHPDGTGLRRVTFTRSQHDTPVWLPAVP